MLAAERRTQSVADRSGFAGVLRPAYIEWPWSCLALTHCLRTPTPAPLLTPRSPECDGLIRRDLAAALAPPLYPYMYRMRRHTIYIEGRATRSGHPDQNEPISPVFRAAAQYDLVQTDTCNRHPPTPVDVPFPTSFPTPFSEDRESGRPVSPLPSPLSLSPLPPTRPLCKTGFEHLPQPPFRATAPSFVNENAPSRLACPGGTFTIRLVSRPQLNGTTPHAHCHRNERRHPDQCHPVRDPRRWSSRERCRNCMSSAASSAAM